MSMVTPGPVPGRRKHGQDRLATGNPMYGLGRTAATSGTVDPSGYVERGRRSGLAKSLLDRRAEAQRPAAGGLVDPQLVGETASRTDPALIVRRLAARMQRPQGV